MKRTDIDFSKHVVTVSKESDNCVIHTLKIPGTVMNMIKFINVDGVMVVTGDFGNWIFCREFIPSEKSSVSDGYWLEKLRISSSQKPSSYDSERTEKAIKERLIELAEEWKEIEAEYGDRSDNSEAEWNQFLAKQTRYEEEVEYHNECLSRVDDELEYTYYAYREMPSSYDSEYVIFVKSVDVWLTIIFDGFDEICNRIREEQKAVV